MGNKIKKEIFDRFKKRIISTSNCSVPINFTRQIVAIASELQLEFDRVIEKHENNLINQYKKYAIERKTQNQS